LQVSAKNADKSAQGLTSCNMAKT